MIVDRDAIFARELVAEVCRKSSLVWVRPGGESRSYALWHVWVDGAVHVIGAGLEQPLPDLADGAEVRVTARSKETGGRVVTFAATVSTVRPEDERWTAVAPELHAKRLNPPDGEQQPARWAKESRLVRLEPTGRLVERPGNLSERSHAAEPPDSPATTRGRVPFVLHRPARRRS